MNSPLPYMRGVGFWEWAAAHFFVGRIVHAMTWTATTPDGAPDGQRQLISRIEASIEPAIKALGFNLVRVKLSGSRNKTLQVMAERIEGSMDVEDCAELSLAVSAVLDVEDHIQGAYVLEVSSPGIDRPLVRREDFERFSGHMVKIELEAPLDGRKRFRGRIKGVCDRTVKLELDNDPAAQTEVALPFDAIKDARLLLDDELIQADLRDKKRHRRRS